jgi:hypothetical protein
MLDEVELWQIPLLVAGAILLGYGLYALVTRRSSRITASWIKVVGLVALGLLVLGLGYQLVKREELPVVSSLATLAVDAFVAWVTTQELKELKQLRLARKEEEEEERQEQPAE